MTTTTSTPPVQDVQAVLLGQRALPRIDPNASPLVQYLQGHRVEVVSIVACTALMLLVFELVRRRQIKEKYSLLWFATGASLLLLTLKRAWLARLAETIGVFYPPTALFLVLGFFVIIILVHFSMVVTRILSQNQQLAQKLALLEAELDELKETGRGDTTGAG